MSIRSGEGVMELERTALPWVGVSYAFATAHGQRLLRCATC